MDVVPVNEKGDKQLIDHYWTQFLVNICVQGFEKMFFKYQDTKRLLKNNQSDFYWGISSLQQIPSTTHEICKAVDTNPS